MHPLHGTITNYQYYNTLKQVWNDKDVESMYNMSSFRNPCPNAVDLGILLAQRHGGSNWVIDKLKEFPSILTDKEMLIGWESNKCSVYSQYIEFTECNDQSLINAMDQHYDEFFQKHSKICDENMKYYYIWNIQIEQIPPKLFKTLIDYFYCHNIKILHLIREATISSFWSLQAEIIGTTDTLELDPEIAAKFVRRIDRNREVLKKLIKLYPKPIKHQQFDYEDLIGQYSDDYWNALLTWIGSEDLLKFKPVSDHNTSLHRERFPVCFQKISNWNDVKALLNGTDSYFACEKQYT